MPPPRIEPVAKLRERAKLNILITAPSGWGKTPLAGTADQRERGGPKACILSVDPEGAVSAAYSGSTADMMEAHSWEAITEATDALEAKVRDKTYGIVVVDSITEVQRLMMRWSVKKNNAENPAKRDPEIPSMDNYLRTQIMLVDYVKRLNAWPCVTIWTAHQVEWEDSEGESRYIPMIHGGKGTVSAEVSGYMMIQANGQFVSEGEDEEAIRRLHFAPAGPYRARDRTGKLPRYMDDPTIPKMLALIQGGNRRVAPAKKAARPLARRAPK